jgi:predicted metal-dependent HD superfamily phosphohydrolase
VGQDPATSSLEDRFMSWCRRGGADASAAASLWSALASHYSEAHRHYHHLGHIASSLAEMDRCGVSDFALEGAIWFHDLIYDPHRSDNEDASRLCFEAGTQAWIDPVMAKEIGRLIDATDFRKPRDEDPGTALMVDIDLAILSAAEETYDAYCRAIRREYAHVDDESFRAGRAKVMAAFLQRPIYRTQFFAAREERARANIQRELASLAIPPV